MGGVESLDFSRRRREACYIMMAVAFGMGDAVKSNERGVLLYGETGLAAGPRQRGMPWRCFSPQRRSEAICDTLQALDEMPR